jgi:hypothetical protein
MGRQRDRAPGGRRRRRDDQNHALACDVGGHPYGVARAGFVAEPRRLTRAPRPRVEAKHTGRLTSAKVQVYDRSQVAPRNNEPSAIIMEIRAVDSSGTPTDKVEASTTIPAREVSDGHIRVATGHFRPGAPVEAGQQYALVLYPPAGGEISWGGSNKNTCPGVATETYESHPRVFEHIVAGGADQYFATYVTTRETTGASANGGGLGDTGGLPISVPALLTLLINGAAIRLLVGRRSSITAACRVADPSNIMG